MAVIKLKVRSGSRLPNFPVGDDDALGGALWALLARAVDLGSAPPAVFVFTAARCHVVDLRPALAQPGQIHRLLSALSGIEGAEVVALLGVLVQRRAGLPPRRFAVVFVESADGRWWLAQRPVDEKGRFREGAEVDVGGESGRLPEEVQRAIDDLPRPGGLGGWFSRMRFEGLRSELRPTEPGLVN